MIMMMKWKKKALIFLISAVVVAVTIVACLFFIPSVRKRLGKREKPYRGYEFSMDSWSSSGVCTSEDCVIEAARILKYMDTKADPCEDFYDYSCGKFLQSHSIPEGWNAFTMNDVNMEELDLNIKSILEEPKSHNDSDSLKKAKYVYKTCLDMGHIDKYGINDLREVLSNGGVGDWPFLNPDWNDCRLDIEWKMAKLNSMGFDSLFRLEMKFAGDENKLFAVLDVASPLVDGICDGDSDNFTEIQNRTTEHREILEAVLKILDVTNLTAIEEDIDDLFEFDFSFCNATKAIRNVKFEDDFETTNMTILNLGDLAPQINWIRWRNFIFSELGLDFPHVKQNIYVNGIEEAIVNINDLLHRTTSKVQANYLTWRFVFHHLGFLGKQFQQIIEGHYEVLSPKLKQVWMSSDRWIPRWRQCVTFIKNVMPLALIPEYGEHMDITSREKKMEIIASLVADEFKKIMKDTRDLAKNDQMRSSHKIGLIQFPLTYPNKDGKFFDKYFKDVNLGDSFLKNSLKLKSYRMRKLFEGAFRGKTIYDMEFAVEALYSAFSSETYSFFQGDQIVISLGALQSCPVNSNLLPMFMTLSTFGWTIGHELAHGFDLIALDGSTEQNWTIWSPSVFQYAKAKAHCFLKFYPVSRDYGVDAAIEHTTLNEDLCDLQGMILAHRAYLRYLSHPYEDRTLPGIPLSHHELFFVSYAQQFCELRQPDLHTPTSPGRNRVNMILQNYPLFSKTFGCSRDSPMNPPKCESIWT